MNNSKLVISFDLMNAIATVLLELPSKTSRLLLNRIEKEVVPMPETPKELAPEIKAPDEYFSQGELDSVIQGHAPLSE